MPGLVEVGCADSSATVFPSADAVTDHDSGIHCGGSSRDWDRVQPEVARFTRVCSYDPAGAGESEPSPASGSMQQMVNELRVSTRAQLRDIGDERRV